MKNQPKVYCEIQTKLHTLLFADHKEYMSEHTKKIWLAQIYGYLSALNNSRNFLLEEYVK